MYFIVVAMLFASLYSPFARSSELDVKLQDLQSALRELETKVSQSGAKELAILAVLRGITTLNDLKKLDPVPSYQERSKGGPWDAMKPGRDALSVALRGIKDGNQRKGIKEEFGRALLRAIQNYAQKRAVRKRGFAIDEQQLKSNREAIAKEIKNASAGENSYTRIVPIIKQYLKNMRDLNEVYNIDYWAALPSMLTKDLVSIIVDLYWMGVDRLEYAISQIPEFGGPLVFNITDLLASNPVYHQYGIDATDINNVIFRSANITFYANNPGDLAYDPNRRLGKSVELGYLKIFRAKYFDVARTLNVEIPALPDGLEWEKKAGQDATNLAEPTEKALLQVIDFTAYNKNKQAYASLEESWNTKPLAEIVKNDKKVLDIVVRALHRHVQRLKKDYKVPEPEPQPAKEKTWRDKYEHISSVRQALEAFEKLKNEATTFGEEAVGWAKKINIPTAGEFWNQMNNGKNASRSAYNQLRLIFNRPPVGSTLYDVAQSNIVVLNNAKDFLNNIVETHKRNPISPHDPTKSVVQSNPENIRGRLRAAIATLNTWGNWLNEQGGYNFPQISREKLSLFDNKTLQSWNDEWNRYKKNKQILDEWKMELVEKELLTLAIYLPGIKKMSAAEKNELDKEPELD